MLDRAMVCCFAVGSLLAAPQYVVQNAGQDAARAANSPLPDIRQLMEEVQNHQRQLDKIRES